MNVRSVSISVQINAESQSKRKRKRSVYTNRAMRAMAAGKRGLHDAERGGNILLAAFLFNYIILGVFFVCIVSDICGLPAFYAVRTHPPVTPEGNLQYVSEHIMRCKYSQHALWRFLPWATLYCFNFMLMQTLHTWTVLHKVEAMQVRKCFGTNL